MIKNGDVVRLKPKFCTETERQYIYAVVNINEKTGRCDISCLNSGLALPPTETVMIEMVDPVGMTVEDIINSQPVKINREKLDEYLANDIITEFETAEEAMNWMNLYDYQKFKNVDEMKKYLDKFGFGIGEKWYLINYEEAFDVYER